MPEQSASRWLLPCGVAGWLQRITIVIGLAWMSLLALRYLSRPQSRSLAEVSAMGTAR